MDLEYLKELKKLETEFASSQRKAFATATINEESFYISLNIFSKLENLEMQDEDFEITREIMSKKRLGTALTEICSDFSKIEKIINKYIEKTQEIKADDSKIIIEVQIMTPLVLELGKVNKYLNLFKNYEFNRYKKELELFIKRKEDVINFNDETFEKSISNIKNREVQDVFNDIINTNQILKEYMLTQTIKSFTIDYLKTFLGEIREIIKIINIYCNETDNKIYLNLSNNQKLFLFNIIENPLNNFRYPLSKVETKIKIDNKYINIWNFKKDFLYKNQSDDKEKNKQLLLKYIKENNIELFNTYRINTIKELLIISIMEIMKNKLTIKKCKNCNKYFVTENRTDEIYCSRISPQNNKKTCKECGGKKTYKEKIRLDPIKKEHERTSQFFRMRIKRLEEETEREKIRQLFEKYKENYKKYYVKYENEKFSKDEFEKWIINQKNIS